MAKSVDEVLESMKKVSTDEEDFVAQLSGKTITDVRLEPGNILLETEEGETVEIGVGYDEMTPNVVTNHNPHS